MNEDASLPGREALIERYEETLIRLAYLDMDRIEAEQLQAAIEADALGVPVAELDMMYARSLPRVAQSIERGARWQRLKRLADFSLPGIAQAAVCVLLALTLGGITAVAAVPAMRARVLKLLINIERQYTELSMVEDESAAFDVPAGWQGSYYMSYIPDGFELGGMDSVQNKVYYLDDQARVLYFFEFSSSAQTNIDTENAEIQMTDINGNVAVLVKKEGTIRIAWAYTDRYFVLDYDGDVETALKIAKSVKLIE